ncbi:MAG: hypothetical protein QM296_03575 [Bacillota bacterium]|nr:hypothetical protein [Bacillota bacterium]
MRDKLGRSWKICSATEMSIRKTAIDAAKQALFAHMDDVNADLLLMSAHKGAHSLRARNHRKLFSHRSFENTAVEGNGEQVKVLGWGSSRYGKPTGILGINCRHSITSYFESWSVSLAECPDHEKNTEPYWKKQAQKAPPLVTYEEEIQELRRDGHTRSQTIRYRMSTSTKNPIGISTRLARPDMAGKSVRFYDDMLSDAQKLYRKQFILDGRELPHTIILSDDEIGPRILASYSAELNTLFLRERVFDKQSLCVAIEAVKANSGISGPFFALEDRPLATFVHELAHWLHAEYARSRSEFGPGYGLHDRMWLTAQAMIEKVIKHYPDFDFRKISPYAERSWEDEPEEVIAEALTRYLLGDINSEVRIIMIIVKEAGYG